jgi:hypothetical protein
MNTVIKNRVTVIVVPIVLGLALALGSSHPSYADTAPVATVTSHLTCLDSAHQERFDISISTTSTVKGVASSLATEVVGETGLVGHGIWYVQQTPITFASLLYPTSRTVRTLEVFKNGTQVATLSLNGSSCQQPTPAVRTVLAAVCPIPLRVCSPAPWWVRR